MHSKDWPERCSRRWPAAVPASPSVPEPDTTPIIRTILADMNPDELRGGATLFHEHLSFSTAFANRLSTTVFPGLNFGKGKGGNGKGGKGKGKGGAKGPGGPAEGETYFLEDADLMTAELMAAKQDGVALLVDGGHEDMGRSFAFLEEISRRSGMPVVASAGYYGQPFYKPEIATMSEDDIASELIDQCASVPVGAFGEIGTWDVQMSPDERKVFRAVGKAQLETNLPIFTHTAFGQGAVEQLDVLEEIGVPADKIVIGHLGGLVDPDVAVQKEICARGAYVGFDRQGGGNDAAQIPMVMALVDAGYADNLMFASDFSVAGRLKSRGGPGYAQVVTVFGPALLAAGMKKETLDHILIDNPLRWLTFVPTAPRGVDETP